MSTSPRRTSPRFSSSALEGTTLALKVAREVADAVPIVRQVVGSLAYISEFAERVQTRREAMGELVEESRIYAHAIDRLLDSDGAMDDKLRARLGRLRDVLHSVESFVEEEEAVRGRLRRMIRSVFVAPNRATGLAGQLKREIRLLKVLTLVSIPIALQQNASYDGQFRRLRDCDVDKKEHMLEQVQDGAIVAWVSARVHGEVMVVRYVRLATSLALARPSFRARSNYLDQVKQLSTVHNSHPNVVKVYGLRPGSPETAFVAFRSGAHKCGEYVKQHLMSMQQDVRAGPALQLVYNLLDASRFLVVEQNLVWCPPASSDEWRVLDRITVNDAGEPTIGLFGDIRDISLNHMALSSSRTFKSIKLILGLQQDRVSKREMRTFHGSPLCKTLARFPTECYDPRLVSVFGILQAATHRPNLTSSIHERFPLHPRGTPMAPSRLSQAKDYFRKLFSASDFLDDSQGRYVQHIVLQQPLMQRRAVWDGWYAALYYRDSLVVGRTWEEDGYIRYESSMTEINHREVSDNMRVILGLDKNPTVVLRFPLPDA